MKDADLDRVINELQTHIRLTLEETGCRVFEVARNQSNQNRFDVYEEFTDQQAFDLHQQRVRNSRWGEITRDAVRHYTINRGDANQLK